MKYINIKKIVGISVLSMFAVLGTATVATAQGGWYSTNQRQAREMQQRRARAAREQARQQERYRREQQRQARLNRNYNSRNGVAYANGSRYRVYRNGRYYTTDGRGAELLRQAVNPGYRQGYEAGRIDRANRRGSQWSRNDMYRSGTFGYQSYVDRGQYQYYFQQGFQKGYDDGYFSRNRYGSYNNGSASILGSILGTILNIRTY